MQANQILPQIALNGQHLNDNDKPASIEARAFVVAFVPNETQQNISLVWANKLTEVIRALVEARSSCHRWAALNAIDTDQLVELLEVLDTHSLDTLVDELVSLATVANCMPELCGVTK